MRRIFLLLPLFALLTGYPVLSNQYSAAQEPKDAKDGDKKLTLRYFGNSFFQLETTKGKRIVFDPHAITAFGRPNPEVVADIVLISHLHNDHTQVGVLADGPRQTFIGVTQVNPKKTEWNPIDKTIGDIKIRTVGTYHDTMQGLQRGKVAVWIVEVDGLKFCHMGDTGHELEPEQIKAIGPIDVLMVPVGGIYALNGEQAKKVVEQLKPRYYVLPMHYGIKDFEDLLGPDEFLDGQKNLKRMQDTNELVIPVGAKAPETSTVVYLGWEKASPKK